MDKNKNGHKTRKKIFPPSRDCGSYSWLGSVTLSSWWYKRTPSSKARYTEYSPSCERSSLYHLHRMNNYEECFIVDWILKSQLKRCLRGTCVPHAKWLLQSMNSLIKKLDVYHICSRHVLLQTQLCPCPSSYKMTCLCTAYPFISVTESYSLGVVYSLMVVRKVILIESLRYPMRHEFLNATIAVRLGFFTPISLKQGRRWGCSFVISHMSTVSPQHAEATSFGDHCETNDIVRWYPSNRLLLKLVLFELFYCTQTFKTS